MKVVFMPLKREERIRERKDIAKPIGVDVNKRTVTTHSYMQLAIENKIWPL